MANFEIFFNKYANFSVHFDKKYAFAILLATRRFCWGFGLLASSWANPGVTPGWGAFPKKILKSVRSESILCGSQGV